MALKKPVSEFKIGDEFEAWFWDKNSDKPMKLLFITKFGAAFEEKYDANDNWPRSYSHHELFDTEYDCYHNQIFELEKQIEDLKNRKYKYSDAAESHCNNYHTKNYWQGENFLVAIYQFFKARETGSGCIKLEYRGL